MSAVLENTIICLDNSEYMRNEDMIPSRLFAQKDSVSMICHSILTSRPENKVGLLALSGPQILQSMTSNEVNVMRRLYEMKPKGEINLITGVEIAYLALKNRSTKKMRIRIIAFIGSPVKADEKALIDLAKRLNKEKDKVIIDIVSFGAEKESNTNKLSAFFKELQSDSSHLFEVKTGQIMSNALINSPILKIEGSNGQTMSWINQNSDPELSLAMKISADELNKEQNQVLNKTIEQSTLEGKNNAKSVEFLQKAIALSLEIQKHKNSLNETNAQKSQKGSEKSSEKSSSEKSAKRDLTDSQGMSEEEQMALALQMSLYELNNELQNKQKSSDSEKSQINSHKNHDKNNINNNSTQKSKDEENVEKKSQKKHQNKDKFKEE